MIFVTCIAPVNIAVIKYWGKKDEKLIIPINDSISGTLSMEQMHSKTTVAACATFTENKFWLNGQAAAFDESPRLQTCLIALKTLAAKKNPDNPLLKYNVRVCSKNNFPTAAGLASSAAGYACLVYALAHLYGVQNEDLTPIARQGSGSACRSLHGGFVHWIKGNLPNGEDSLAVQLATENHWPEIRVLILVVNDSKKKVSSTKGMANSVRSSELLIHRVQTCVNEKVLAIKKAIQEKDFKTFGEITMKDSNQFHAVCLDSYPPSVYMNDVSHKIAHVVHRYNKAIKAVKVAYTFDAGPNACLYMLDSEVSQFISILDVIFPHEKPPKHAYIRGIPVDYLSLTEEKMLEITKEPYEKDLLKYIIHTKLGEGPKKLDPNESLLNDKGLPLAVA